MSDDEGGVDDVYEDDLVDLPAEDAATDAASTAAAEEESSDDGEADLGGEAAGTDDEESEEDEDTTAAEEEEAEEAASRLSAAIAAEAASEKRTDPIVRAANKSRPVRVVASEDRVTDSRLQRSEMALIVSMRATQIDATATHFTDATGLHDPVDIAMKELRDRRCPLVLRRVIGTGPAGETVVEEWNVREMTLSD